MIDTMVNEASHISVCICTYKRPGLLRRLLEKLGEQETGGAFTYSIVVADNDHLRSAESVVRDVVATSGRPITYCVEPRQNIALARNKAIEHAHGEFVAFIDDDEFPTNRWLMTLFSACRDSGVEGVLGPVKRYFDEEPPTWVKRGNFYERPTYRTGLVIDWKKGRTNNVLLRRRIFVPDAPPFRPEFRTGEDQDFFQRMIDAGHVFIWCNEAVAYEVVPPVRWRRSFMLRRALLQGTICVMHPTFGAFEIARSLIAVPAYTATLPFALVLGQHRFMTRLVKLCHHLGTLLGLAGINAIKEPYVTE